MPQYSEDFKARVKAEFPEDPFEITKHLENGSEFVGRFLDDNRVHLCNKTVRVLAEQGDVQGILNLCDKVDRRDRLYSDYWKERK